MSDTAQVFLAQVCFTEWWGGSGGVRKRLKVSYVATSWKFNYKHNDIWRTEGAICTHEHDSKCKIYVVLYRLLGASKTPEVEKAW